VSLSMAWPISADSNMGRLLPGFSKT